jgi:hypothetical protein
MSYEKDFIEMDEFGIVAIHCAKCWTPVIVRSYREVPSATDPGKTVMVMAMKRLANHVEVPVALSDGSTTGIPHCTKCSKESMDVEKVNSLRISAMRRELEGSGKSQEYVDGIMSRHEEVKVDKKGMGDLICREISQSSSRLQRDS